MLVNSLELLSLPLRLPPSFLPAQACYSSHACPAQCSSAADSSPTTKRHDSSPCNPKGNPVAQSSASKQPHCAAAQQPSTPANQQSCSTTAVQRRSQVIFQLRRPCSIAAMYSCLAAVLPCSNHRTRQRSMFGLPKAALPIS